MKKKVNTGKVKAHVSSLLAVLALCATVFSGGAYAQKFYSVDQSSASLVVIDASNGQVSPIGPLGRFFGDTDLTLFNGKLYASNWLTELPSLYEINQCTGAATLLGRITVGGMVPAFVEGLTHSGGKLYSSLRTARDLPFSNLLVELSLTGEGLDPFDYQTIDLLFGTGDMDGLASDASGNLFSVDVLGGPAGFGRLHQVGINPRSYTFVGASNPGQRYADLEFAGDSLFAPGFEVQTLYEIARNTGMVIRSISLAPQGNYQGLAIAPDDTSTPTWLPGSTLLATNIGPTSLTLTWTPAVDNCVRRYRVFQDGSLRGIVAGTVNTLAVTGLTCNTPYTFKVEACDLTNCSTDGPSVNVVTLTPQEAIQRVIDSVNALVASGVLNPGQGSALTSTLQTAIRQLNQGNTTAARNGLQAFMQEVSAFVTAGILPSAQGQSLISQAQTVLSCFSQ